MFWQKKSNISIYSYITTKYHSVSSIQSIVLHTNMTAAMVVHASCFNKANLRDLIAATGLVISLKFDSNRPFFSSCDLENWWMTSKNNRASLLYYIKHCASFQIHLWTQTRVTVQIRSIPVKIGDFLSRGTLQFGGWPWKTIGHLFYATLSFVYHLKSIGKLKLKLQSGNAQFGAKLVIFCLVWPWNLTDDLQKQ